MLRAVLRRNGLTNTLSHDRINTVKEERNVEDSGVKLFDKL